MNWVFFTRTGYWYLFNILPILMYIGIVLRILFLGAPFALRAITFAETANQSNWITGDRLQYPEYPLAYKIGQKPIFMLTEEPFTW